MGDYRIYVEKKEGYQVESKSMQADLNLNLSLNLKNVRVINVYDLFGFTKDLLNKARYQVFGEVVTDTVSDTLDLNGKKYIATEYLPGQFDQRASSAIDCCKLINPNAKINIRSGRIIVLDDDIKDSDLERIKKYVINAVEAREKDLSVLSDLEKAEIKPVSILEGFTEMSDVELPEFCKKYGLAMNQDDLKCVVKYFKEEGRDPWETELRILDTYWSDHCRHTTFNTILTEITIDESFMKKEMNDCLNLYYKMRKDLDRENKKLICNMEYDYENNESTFIAEIDLQKYVDAIAHCIYNMQDYSENMHFNEIKNYFINQTCYELFSKNNLFITNLTLDKMVYFVYDNKDIIGVSNKFKISRKENSIYLRMDNYVYSHVLNNINNYNVQIYIYNNNNIIAIEDYDIEILDNDRNFINIIFRNSQLINYSDKYPKVEYIKFDNDYIKKLQGILVKPEKITDNNKYKINNIDNIFDDL